jgi:hypothetical protein
MTAMGKILLSPPSDANSLFADRVPIPSTPEAPTVRPRSVAQAEIIDKWKRKFIFGLRSENTQQTA